MARVLVQTGLVASLSGIPIYAAIRAACRDLARILVADGRLGVEAVRVVGVNARVVAGFSPEPVAALCAVVRSFFAFFAFFFAFRAFGAIQVIAVCAARASIVAAGGDVGAGAGAGCTTLVACIRAGGTPVAGFACSAACDGDLTSVLTAADGRAWVAI